MDYVNTELSKVIFIVIKNGTQLKMLVRNKEYDAKISKMPFVSNRFF